MSARVRLGRDAEPCRTRKSTRQAGRTHPISQQTKEAGVIPPSAALSGPLSALVRPRHESPQPSGPHSVVDRPRKSRCEHPMKSRPARVNAAVKRQRIDIGTERIQEILPHSGVLSLIESVATSEISACRLKNPDLHGFPGANVVLPPPNQAPLPVRRPNGAPDPPESERASQARRPPAHSGRGLPKAPPLRVASPQHSSRLIATQLSSSALCVDGTRQSTSRGRMGAARTLRSER